jgi:hypothetical protein
MRYALPVSTALFLVIALACGGKSDTPATTPEVTPPVVKPPEVEGPPPLPLRWEQITQRDGAWAIEKPCEGDTRSIMLDAPTPTKITIGHPSAAEGFNVTSTSYQNNTYTFTLVSPGGTPATASLTRGTPHDTWAFTTVDGSGPYANTQQASTLPRVDAENCGSNTNRKSTRTSAHKDRDYNHEARKHKKR